MEDESIKFNHIRCKRYGGVFNFYREGLGFEVVVYGEETNPDVMFFNNGGTKISLFPIERLVKDINEANPPEISQGFGGITLAYNGKSKEEDRVFALAKRPEPKLLKSPKRYSGVAIVAIFKIQMATIGKLPMATCGSLMRMIC